MTCNECIHKAVCYRYSYGLPNNFADKCGDFKALEQEPCEDAISREDVIALVQCSEYELQDRVDNDAMCDDVRKLPSVTPSSRKGHWIVDDEVVDKSRKPTTYHFDTHCSECGFKYAYTTDKEDSIPTNYCPNCGVNMEGVNR